ncbi:MAG TPA: ATP-binding cassette domain-containing protein [bacterium]|nr:ATP-binding cassette domain-containing protein [bacterium]HPP88600.1 ATP-binding cassette domain-containing protein [bacterium]
MIEIIDCSKSYENIVLNNVSLKIKDKSFIILKGLSGVGKSTLLNIIAGIVKPDSGIVKVNNIEITELSDSALAKFRNANISYIRQTQGLVHWLNIRDNLELPFYIDAQDMEKSAIKKMIDSISEQFGITNILKKYPEKISGGQYQRAAIASSIIKSQNIILADEPTNNLDKNNIKILMDIFKKYKSKKTIIIVSHIDIFDELADEILLIENGKIQNV